MEIIIFKYGWYRGRLMAFVPAIIWLQRLKAFLYYKKVLLGDFYED